MDGKTYKGNRYNLGSGSTASDRYDSEQKVRDAVGDRFRVGTDITVHYDPDDPSSAVLEAGASLGTWAPLILGLFFLPLGFAGVVGVSRQARTATSNEPAEDVSA